MIFNLILIFIYPLIILVSTIGYGLIFKKFFFKNDYYLNISILGIFGLFSLYILSSITHLFVPHNIFHNSLVHFIGLLNFFFLKDLIKKKEIKLVFTFFIILFLGFIISKTNEDFPYYHLPMSLQIVEQKLQFGIGNINVAYNHFSSLFHINSLFYLPLVKYYLFNLTNFLFQIFFFSGLFLILKDKKIPNFLVVLISLTLLIYILKFNRLAEYGADLPGQLLAIMSIIFCYIAYFGQDQINKKNLFFLLEISFYLIIFATTTKILYAMYIIIPLSISLKIFKINDLLKYFLKLRFLFISFLSLTTLIFYNFALSGCLVYPISSTCFYETFSWTLEKETIDHMKTHYNAWSKGVIGAGFGVSDTEKYLSNFYWIKNWFNKYFFTKVSDFILLNILIFLIYFFSFKKDIIGKINQNNKKNSFFILQVPIIFVLLVWFFNFPTLRYAGYSIVFLFLALPFCFYISSKIDVSKDIFLKKFQVLFIIALIVFNFKNVLRINNELNLELNQHHNFSNFPFYWINQINYKKVKSGKIVYNLVEGPYCWSTPSVCITAEGLTVKKVNNYLIHYKK